MATNFSLDGDVGQFVRQVPFDTRSISYLKSGLGDTLGSFVGSARQNLALFNYGKQQANQPPIAQPGAVSGQRGVSGANPELPGEPGAGQTDSSGFNAAAYFQFQGSPDIFDASGVRQTPEQAQAAGLFAPEQSAYGGNMLSKKVSLLPYARPEVQSEQDFAKLGGQDIAGTTVPNSNSYSAPDILTSVQQHPDVQFAQQYHDTLLKSNDAYLNLQIQNYANKAQVDVKELQTKALQAKNDLLKNLESRGLAGSSFQTKGEEAIKSGQESGITQVQQGLSQQEQELQAQNISKTYQLDYNLAKTIVSAVDKEVQARADVQKQQQTQMDKYLSAKGLVINPITGEVEKTATQEKADQSSVSAYLKTQGKQVNPSTGAVETIPVKPKTVSTTTTPTQKAVSSMRNEMKITKNPDGSSAIGKDGKLRAEVYNFYKKEWVNSGRTPASFDSQFADLRNPKDSGYDLTKATSSSTSEKLF